jgi:uncharacterized protein (TIGR03437 family)
MIGSKQLMDRNLRLLLAALAGFTLVASAQVTPNPIPARVLGQLNRPATYSETVNPSSVAPNLLEGRELFGPVAVAVDTSLDPPAVYVSDTKNSRVLGWRNAAQFDNGAPADIVIGQKDFLSSAAAAPTTARHSTLTLPAAMVVGPNSTLFVYDAGNNRILRFPSPFDEANKAQEADLVIGQQTRIARNPNQSSSTTALPSATTLKSSQTVASRLTTYLSSLAFDPEGNLWATDAGNHRVLRYAADAVNGPGNIQSNGEVEPQIAANRVLGQLGMELAVPNPARISNINDRISKLLLRGPAALAFDTAGNLYVSDDLARVLFYRAPMDSDGKPADRILGIPSAPGLTPVNDVMFGYAPSATDSSRFGEGARGVFCIRDIPFVVDSLNSRILRFAAPADWPAESTEYSPHAQGVIGQFNFVSGQGNRFSHWEPNSSSFRNPSSAIFAGNEVWVADTDNNRVLTFPNFLEAGDDATAVRLLGQVAYEYRAPNFIQGREFSAGSLTSTTQLSPHAVVDRGSNPPRLYLADPGNNRVLAWSDARKAQGGDFADIVIGQVDYYRALVNSPYSDFNSPSETGLFLPSVVALDKDGNLWVADTGNSRVLRYPRPFDEPGKQQLPDLVIGRESMTSVATLNPAAASLGFPSGLAFSLHGQLYVSDMLYNRVLRFDPPFASGMEATMVFGQPDYVSTATGSADGQLNYPLGLAVDTDDRLYVADVNNKRVAIFSRANQADEIGTSAGMPIRLTSGSMLPTSVAVSQTTGEIFVADASGSRVRRFQSYGPLMLSGTVAANFEMTGYGPRNVTLDASGNLLVVDSANRLTMHYPQLFASNWQSGFFRLTPGLMTRVLVPGVKLAAEAVSVPEGTLPKELAGLEVLVDGAAAPIYSISDDNGAGLAQIQIPTAAPIKGTAEIVIRNRETSEILASQVQSFDKASPAFMVANAPGGGQVVAYNSDGTMNSAASPAVRGTEVTLYLVGYGQIDGAPEDGTSSDVEVPLDGILAIGNQVQVLSSRLDPERPGLWKIQAKLDASIVGAASNNYQVPVALLYRDLLSNQYVLGTTTVKVSTSIAIKP